MSNISQILPYPSCRFHASLSPRLAERNKMNTDTLLRNTYKRVNNKDVAFTKEELTDRRMLLRRILKESRFESCTNEELDKMTAQQLSSGGYIINDTNGCEWMLK